ncbi:MAG: acyl-CoA synthetase [Proteobacteria bacterium]|nr:acyl-CoA synthetase [Pseudomonadota bacterium]MBS0217825.1 acyl-CoA synthetase [Pseudomonadota bacterium]
MLAGAGRRPLLDGSREQPVLFAPDGVPVSRGEFLARVRALAAALPQATHVINLCERRDAFIIGLCAAASRGQVTLLPPSRAEDVVAEVQSRHPGSYRIGDAAANGSVDVHVDPASPGIAGDDPLIDPQSVFVIGFTSGSTGAPMAYPKTFAGFRISTAQNVAALDGLLDHDEQFSVVATVPPQHMYGMELSVLLPLVGPAAVHAGRPFFPQDIAAALAQVPAPRLLVTTPLHLRALVESGVELPELKVIVTATAPLPQELALAAETRYGCEVREMFGSTETCVIARRRTAHESDWTLLPGVELQPQAEGTLVLRESLPQPVLLADLVELDGRRFALRGRSADLLEIAGKRASLADLTRRLQQVPGVRDGVMAQAAADAQGVRRLIAIVVAENSVGDEDMLAVLRRSSDPVFLPRRIVRVDALPRNETGKLPRAEIDAIIERDARARSSR